MEEADREIKLGICLNTLDTAAKELSKLGFKVTVSIDDGHDEKTTKSYNLYGRKVARTCQSNKQ